MKNKNTLPNDFLLIHSSLDKGTNKVVYKVWHFASAKIIFTKSFPIIFSVNIVNFFAVVKALMYCKAQCLTIPIFSNNYSVIKWVNDKKLKEKGYENPIVSNLASRAMTILCGLKNTTLVKLWETPKYGLVSKYFNKHKY